MKKYIRRLLKEWILYKKIIIAVDFDDTIYNFKLNNYKDQQKTVNLLFQAQKLGCYIVIFTSREPERHHEIYEYCKEIGLKFDSINVNPVKLPYGNNGKIYYNINLCDRSGLHESLKILKKTMKKYRKYV